MFGWEMRQLITWYTLITQALILLFTNRNVQNKFPISFYNKAFWAFRQPPPPPPPPPWTSMPFLYDLWKVIQHLYAKGLVWARGIGTSDKLFLSSICWIANKSSLLPIFLNRYLSNEKTAFADNSRVEPYYLFHWKNIIFFETFLWSFLWAILH